MDLFAVGLGWMFSAPRHLRVLTFHHVGDDQAGPYTLGRRRFQDFVLLLKDEGYRAIRCADLAATWPEVLKEERVAVLTFDDGYASHCDFVAETLACAKMTGTFFVIASLLKQERTRADFARGSHVFMSARDLRQLRSAGFEIGSHSYSHLPCGSLPQEKLAVEIEESKGVIQEQLGGSVTTFSYPYGQRGAFSRATRAVLAQSGFQAAFTQLGTRITPQTDLLAIPRINIGGRDSIRTFKRKLQGRYELFASLRNHGKQA